MSLCGLNLPGTANDWTDDDFGHLSKTNSPLTRAFIWGVGCPLRAKTHE